MIYVLLLTLITKDWYGIMSFAQLQATF